MAAGHVFGYGSLLGLGVGAGSGAAAAAGVACRLPGYRRSWNVAMDNSVDLPGYKYYVDPVTRDRPDVMVAFLNIEEDPATYVNGIVFTVDELEELDDRERNYRRRDLAGLLPIDFGGPVWAYVGTAQARRRFEVGLAGGRTVISREYHDGVLAGFGSVGPQMVDEFRRTTRAPAVPLVELLRLAVDARADQFGTPRADRG